MIRENVRKTKRKRKENKTKMMNKGVKELREIRKNKQRKWKSRM